jgi:hypothetical protein
MSFSGWNTDLAKRPARLPAAVFVEDVNEPRWAVKGPAGFFDFRVCGDGKSLAVQDFNHALEFAR